LLVDITLPSLGLLKSFAENAPLPILITSASSGRSTVSKELYSF
jgi:hypothetical protein